MTETRISTQDWVGRRVEGGSGEDHDTGTVDRVIDEHTVMVRWDSLVDTPAPITDLRLLNR